MTSLSRALACSAPLFAAGLLALPSQAQTLNYAEDFESFAVGGLAGQSGWASAQPNQATVQNTGIAGWGGRSLSLESQGFSAGAFASTPLGAWTAPEGRFAMDVVVTNANTAFDFIVEQSGIGANVHVSLGVGTISIASVNSGLLTFQPTTGTWTPGVPFRIGIEVEDGGTVRVYKDGQAVGQGAILTPGTHGPMTRVGVYSSWTDPGTSPGTLLIDNIIYDTCPLPEDYCPATPNSNSPTGALMLYTGSRYLEANDGALFTFAAAASVPCIYIASTTQAQIPFGDGSLCLGAPRKRLGPTQVSSPSGLPFTVGGNVYRQLDFTVAPLNQVTAGSTWNFQLWFRDNAAGGAGTNFSNATSVTFCP